MLASRIMYSVRRRRSAAASLAASAARESELHRSLASANQQLATLQAQRDAADAAAAAATQAKEASLKVNT